MVLSHAMLYVARMPIPAFTIDGVLPPFVGPLGPGGSPQDMTPYVVSAVEIVATLATTAYRQTILRNWLTHRAALRSIGFDKGFQWLDGSFVEQKVPQDIDIVTFTNRPTNALDLRSLSNLVHANIGLFDHILVKKSFLMDAFFVDLNGSPENLVNLVKVLAWAILSSAGVTAYGRECCRSVLRTPRTIVRRSRF